MVHAIWGRSLRASPQSRVLVMGMNAPGMMTDWVLLRRSVVVLAAVLVAFVFAAPLQLQPATIALAGAAVLMLLDNWQHRGAGRRTTCMRPSPRSNGPTIFFFIGLFVVVHAVEASGFLDLSARGSWR